MHPAFSVIFFTVTSGAGYGLIAITAIYSAFDFSQPMTGEQTLLLSAVALVLITSGLISSTFHLANPKNAWRAFSRVRTSWLAREGLLAILFYPIVMLYVYLVWRGVDASNSTAMTALALLTGVWAIVTVFSTGMIYASLKTIRQWNNALTPVNYISLGLMLGGLLFSLLLSLSGDVSANLTMVASYMVVIAATIKIVYFFWIGTPAGPTINTATSFTSRTVRLLDVGHTAGTFLTDEFGYQVARDRLVALRWVAMVLGFILPSLIVWFGLGEGDNTLMLAAAVISAFAGVAVERWLFFAEARHVVNLYHGAQQC
ncbi:MAG: dimethyl sulfoxide reductase anchor subunit [Gammaproteobacteria bacterium]|jgi:DMSO reductase anchor subunit|nr:dimethyl sulfoxide reductase anchor subunit [Gammaproteobacteria bacterium]